MKKIIILFACTAVLICCKSKNNKTDEPVVQNEVPVTETPIQQIIVTDTTSVTDTTTVPEFTKEYPTLILDTKVPVEIYASDNFEGPTDSVLLLAGIVMNVDSNKNTITFTTDSSIIPQDINIAYKKGKVIVTQYGKSTEYSAKRIAIENEVILIDDKPILPEKVLTVLRIGIPGNTPVVFNGNNTNYTASVQLGKVEINATGASSISLLSVKSGSMNAKGESTISINDGGFFERISISDSARITFKSCDSIYFAHVIQKGRLELPAKTPIAKETTKGDGDIVKQ